MMLGVCVVCFTGAVTKNTSQGTGGRGRSFCFGLFTMLPSAVLPENQVEQVSLEPVKKKDAAKKNIVVYFVRHGLVHNPKK